MSTKRQVQQLQQHSKEQWTLMMQHMEQQRKEMSIMQAQIRRLGGDGSRGGGSGGGRGGGNKNGNRNGNARGKRPLSLSSLPESSVTSSPKQSAAAIDSMRRSLLLNQAAANSGIDDPRLASAIDHNEMELYLDRSSADVNAGASSSTNANASSREPGQGSSPAQREHQRAAPAMAASPVAPPAHLPLDEQFGHCIEGAQGEAEKAKQRARSTPTSTPRAKRASSNTMKSARIRAIAGPAPPQPPQPPQPLSPQPRTQQQGSGDWVSLSTASVSPPP